MAELGMTITGATLANLAEGRLEEQFQDMLPKVVEVFAESEQGDRFEITGKSLVCKVPLEVEFVLDVETRAVTVGVRANFSGPKRKMSVRAAFVRSGAVLVEETRQEALPLEASNVAPIRGKGGEGK